MEEVSVGAAGSTSVVDLSGDSHLQVIFNPTETFSQHDPSRLIFRTPCQRRTKWSSQSTQEQVDKFPDRDQHYLSETYIISKGMPEFAKSEFSVIRLHEVNVTAPFYSPLHWRKNILGVMLWQSCKQDFIWLHDVIQENLQYAGFIIPPKVLLLFLHKMYENFNQPLYSATTPWLWRLKRKVTGKDLLISENIKTFWFCNWLYMIKRHLWVKYGVQVYGIVVKN